MPVTFQIMTFPVDGEGRHGVANTVFVLLSYTSYSVDDVAPGGTTYQMSTCPLRLISTEPVPHPVLQQNE